MHPAQSRPRPEPVRGRELLLAVGVWVLWFGGIFAATLLLLRVMRVALLREHPADVAAILMLLGYSVLLGALLLAFGGPGGLRGRLGFRITSIGWLLLAPVLWLGTLVAGTIVSLPLSHFFGRPPETATQLLGRGHDPLYMVLVALTACALAPALEEMFFRGALFGWLRLRVPVPAAAALSAAVFAGAHLSPLLLPYLFLFGLVTAYVYEKSGSTLNTFVMHACQNTTALVAAYALTSRGTPG